ncbi:hypothetical protein GIB67_040956 [Kingdonia uniflora]|uniref:Remorin C-terminal domain-containing protein n=1 Tax=Kingdonia uniflora TaxID=39325 RepID=A0A7J7M6C7_9MAGN|nr:hypothetical protein GIB67_040956 [Kingdonia uniflora]
MGTVEEEKGCYNYGPTHEISTNNSISFEFHKGSGTTRSSHHRMPLGKPTPSKWDDAQKWLVGLSRGGERNNDINKPRNSNADDRRLITSVPQKEEDSSSTSADSESFWRINKPSSEDSLSAIRSIYVRDTGTEMTPIASLEPSRTTTPVRATTPIAISPISSRSSTPRRGQQGVRIQSLVSYQTGFTSFDDRSEATFCGEGGSATRWSNREEESNGFKTHATNTLEQNKKPNPLETRAMAWDEAERAKYTASGQKWAKAERLKSRAQEKLTNKLAATQRIAEEKRANAEATLNEQAARTSERANYMKKTGHFPSSFSFKLPSSCW